VSLYHFDNARNAEQLSQMRRLDAEATCLFCPEHLGNGHVHRILGRTSAWSIIANRYPYKETKLHLLLIPDQHVADILDLSDASLADFWIALAWIRRTYTLEYYGVAMRCGDCRYTGGTIQHVHVHVIVGDVENPAHEGVRVRLSSRPGN
jgi:ATP adenylyltransferase